MPEPWVQALCLSAPCSARLIPSTDHSDPHYLIPPPHLLTSGRVSTRRHPFAYSRRSSTPAYYSYVSVSSYPSRVCMLTVLVAVTANTNLICAGAAQAHVHLTLVSDLRSADLQGQKHAVNITALMAKQQTWLATSIPRLLTHQMCIS